MQKQLFVSAYGSHNATIAAYHDGRYYVIELERWLNKKNSGLNGYLPTKLPQRTFDDIISFIFSETNTNSITKFMSNYVTKIDLSKYNIQQQKRFDHHMAHACCAFYQSPYNESLIFTYDGGGNGAFFNVYIAENRETGPKLINRFDIDLGFPYMVLADHLEDITRDPLNIGNLVYAGKLMGLCAYGEVNEQWLPHFEQFYRKFKYGGNSFLGGAEVRYDATMELFSNIGVDDFDIETTRFSGKFAWDVAATSQQAFENIFLEYALPYINKYPTLPICLAGGCALNVILNSKLLKYNSIFVPPNSNDSGIAIGGLLEELKPMDQVDITYSGLPIMDATNFGALLEDSDTSVLTGITEKDIATLLQNNYIIGIINGTSEHGPRALGNRSIICNPIGDMKDVLNSKVKNREWYRPFAPVVRLEDVNTYFEFSGESRHMTFIAKVKDTFPLPAITHVDGTGRLQTVTRDQNKFLYDIITEFESQSGYGVILNTSFNVNGKPILTRLSDAFEILNKTELDCVYYDNNLIFKYNKEREIKKLLRDDAANKNINNSCTYVIAYTENYSDITNIIPEIKNIEKNSNKICILANSNHSSILVKAFPNINFWFIDNNRFYYKELLHTYGYSGKELNFIKPLWIKDVVVENNNSADYHIVIDIFNSTAESYINFKNSITKDFDITCMSSHTNQICNSVKDLLIHRKVLPDDAPSFTLYSGGTDAILDVTRTYEGNFRYHLMNNKGNNDSDFLYIDYVENSYKYSLLGQ